MHNVCTFLGECQRLYFLVSLYLCKSFCVPCCEYFCVLSYLCMCDFVFIFLCAAIKDLPYPHQALPKDKRFPVCGCVERADFGLMERRLAEVRLRPDTLTLLYSLH